MLALEGRIEWVWVDCFTRFPLDRRDWLRLTDAGFQLCLVSPDLVGRVSRQEIHAMRGRFEEWSVEPDAVCAKLAMLESWTEPLR